MMRTRFAPSPTGWLHLGHARAAAEAFGWARMHGREAECLLRIEDIDAARCKSAYTRGIFEDLRWLGFGWPEPVRVQSAHLEDYARVAERLREMGVLYPCDMSRAEVAARTVDGVFRGEAVGGDNAPWRLDVRAARERLGEIGFMDNGREVEVDWNRVPDAILVRRDTPRHAIGGGVGEKEWGTSYAIAATHDDHLQGITHVVRGEDLRATTPVQRILQGLMGWRVPAYHHHDLVMDGERKLSKRDGDASLREMRARGVSAAEVLARARGKPRPSPD